MVRWNSFFAMLTSILDQHEKISRALVECRKEDLKLNDNEILVVRNLTNLLKYFPEATVILQVGQTHAINKVIPVCQMLSKAVASFDFTEDECCNQIKEASLNSLEKRFEYVKSSPKHIFCNTLRPSNSTLHDRIIGFSVLTQNSAYKNAGNLLNSTSSPKKFLI